MDSTNKPQLSPPVSFDEFEPTEYGKWKEEATAALKGAPFEKALFTKTYEGITLNPIYTAGDSEAAAADPGFPGVHNYLRGTCASGYIVNPWNIAQALTGTDAAEVNRLIRYEISKGGGEINILLDDAIHYGGSEPANSGRLFIRDLKDMQTLLKDVSFDKVGIHIYGGANAPALLSLLAASVDPSLHRSLRGCVGADPIALLAQTGHLPCFIDELYDELALTIHWARENMPSMKTILIRGDIYHNAGANATQEVACALAEAAAYIDALQLRGLRIDDICASIRFSFSLGANFFMEIAKLRAARKLWSKLTKAYDADPDLSKMDIYAETSRFTMTEYDPYVNILRTTTQAFSGVVGGVNSMNVLPFDTAVGVSDEQSRRIARNIQHMFRNEFDMLRPVDPAGGSWYVETLTMQLSEKSWQLFQNIDAQGGIVLTLKTGSLQKDIDSVLESRLRNLATRKDRFVGTNMYANMTEKPLSRPSPIQAAETEEVEISAECKHMLKNLPGAISGEPQAFVAGLTEAFKAKATLHQVRKALNDGFETDITVEPLSPHRWTEQYEALRKRTEEYEKKTGSTIKVFLANMGPIPQHKARADFTAGFLEVGHFEILRNDGFATVEEAADAMAESGCDAAVICSTDKTYPELVPPLARLMKKKRPEVMVYLAGAPAAEYKDAYTEAGVDDFIHVKANCLEILKYIQKQKGVF